MVYMMEDIIRVLCVFSTLDRGGAESMCMNLYRNIDRHRVQFDFVKHTQNVGAFESEILSLGGRIYQAPRFTITNHGEYCQWWKKHFEAHPEHKIVHGHFFTISAVYFKVAQKYNRITVGHSHASPTNSVSLKYSLAHILVSLLVSKIEKYSDYCFACSKPAGEWIFKHKTFTVLNNAVDSELFRYDPLVRQQLRTEFGLENALVLGTVGNIAEVKNPYGMLEIIKAVQKKEKNIKMLWVGNKGQIFSALMEKTQEEGLSESVVFTGVRPDVDRILQAMDAFILPSFSEGLSVVTIEAQAAGLPCFISEAVPREAEITDLCTFLPINDPEKWADAILKTDFSHRRDTTQMIIDAGYDIHTTAKWLEDFYLRIANE